MKGKREKKKREKPLCGYMSCGFPFRARSGRDCPWPKVLWHVVVVVVGIIRQSQGGRADTLKVLTSWGVCVHRRVDIEPSDLSVVVVVFVMVFH